MLGHPLDRDPVGHVVGQCIGDGPDATRGPIQAGLRMLVVEGVEHVLARRVDLVAHPLAHHAAEVEPLGRRDEPVDMERDAFGLEGVDDVGRCLKLGVILAAVADDRDVEGVAGVVDAVINHQGLPTPLGDRLAFEPGVFDRLR